MTIVLGVASVVGLLATLALRDNARLRARLAQLEGSRDSSEDRTGAAAIKEPYEVGYRDGENSASLDWGLALDEVLPPGVSGFNLDGVVEYIRKVQGERNG